MKYDFDEIVERHNTGCDKYDKCQETFGTNDLIPLWIADMDFKIAKPITDALIKRTEHQIFGYTFQTNTYFDAIINWQNRHNGWSIKREWISYCPGVVPGLHFAVRGLTKKGDKIVFLTPAYPPFYGAVNENGRVLVESELVRKGNEYFVDYDDLEKKLSDATLFIFCNPHNPIGKVWNMEELEKISRLCLKYKVKILSDEIHSDLIFPPNKHIPLASTSEEVNKNCITFFAPSKTFNIAGLSTGVAVSANPEILESYVFFIRRLHMEQGNAYGITALEAAYDHGEEWLNQLLPYLYENSKYVVGFFEKNMPRIKVQMPQGTYVLWIDFRKLGLSQEKLIEFLVKDAKVGLNDGESFGKPSGTGFMRLNLACPRSVLENAMDKILRAYKLKFS